MFNLFSKKKKFKANCELSKTPLSRESAYMISTADIISSKKFWDNIMTEPDTLSYTEAYFKQNDETALNIRRMIFKKYAEVDKAWVISDGQIHLFDVDHNKSKSSANSWWDSEGQEVSEGLKSSLSKMDKNDFEAYKTYVLNEAGRAHVAV